MNWKSWKAGLVVAIVIGFISACIAAGALDGVVINVKFLFFFLGLIGKDVILYLKDHPVDKIQDDPPASRLPLLLLLFIPLLLWGCASVRTVQKETAPDGTTRETRFTARTFFDSHNDLSKASTTMTEKSQGVRISGLEQDASGTNAVSLIEKISGAVVGAAINAAK